MSYHQRYLQTPFHELPETSRGLILALMHATGSCFIAIGLALGFLVWGPISAHASWAVTVALILLLSVTFLTVIVTLKVGYYTPWWMILLLGATSVLGLLFF